MLTLLLPIITLPYISRTLGSEGVGLNSYSLSIVTIFFLIGSFGTAVYGQRQVAYSRNNLKELSNVF
ncbi:oligosaccharide flippase family protein [Enterococcus casseliflavus]